MTDCRLIYRSTSTEEVISNATLRALVETCSTGNAKSGITGLLVLSGERFLQVLEGPSRAVNHLFSNISRDDRHREVELLSFEAIGPRYFDQWNMRLIDLDDLQLSDRNILAGKYQTHDAEIVIPTQLHLVYALLLDAKAMCLSQPWTEESNSC